MMDSKRILSCFVLMLTCLYVSASAQDLPGIAPPLIDEVTDPVAWQPWSERSFQKASEEKKPVLLSVEARWQYETEYLRMVAYHHRPLVELINRNFLPIRVDADQRPDILKRYAPEGIPQVVFLSAQGMPILNQENGKVLEARSPDAEELLQLCNAVLALARANGLEQQAMAMPEPWKAKEAKADPFGEDYARIILRNLALRHDDRFGGYGDPSSGYSPKRPHPEALRLLLTASQLLKDSALVTPLDRTLKGMAGGSFYQQGFGEVSDTRDWNRLRDEKTLGTNMALLDLYLRTFKATRDNRFMELAYQILEDTAGFQDMFLRKGFSGAFYSAQRAMVPRDVERGLKEGPMIQSLITPWVCQAIESYLLAAEVTGESRWQKLGERALEFLLTEMIHSNGRVAYSLDRQALGDDHLFAAHSALAGTLVEAFQRTSDRRYLEQAESLMRLAEDTWWVEPGYFSDVLVEPSAVGLLRRPLPDLNANARAVEVYVALAIFTGNEDYRRRAKEILTSLAGEAQEGDVNSAAFAIASLKYIHSPVHAVVAGDPGHSRTTELRDACHALPWVHLLVEVVEPERNVERLAALNLLAVEQPSVSFRRGMITTPAIEEPEQLSPALEQLLQRTR